MKTKILEKLDQNLNPKDRTIINQIQEEFKEY